MITGAITYVERGVGTLSIDAASRCVYVESVLHAETMSAWRGEDLSLAPDERLFLNWAEGTLATSEGVTTVFGEFIPDDGLILLYGIFFSLDAESRTESYANVSPAFHHCLDGATHGVAVTAVRSGCLECTELRPWPGAAWPGSIFLDCEAPLC